MAIGIAVQRDAVSAPSRSTRSQRTSVWLLPQHLDVMPSMIADRDHVGAEPWARWARSISRTVRGVDDDAEPSKVSRAAPRSSGTQRPRRRRCERFSDAAGGRAQTTTFPAISFDGRPASSSLKPRPKNLMPLSSKSCGRRYGGTGVRPHLA
jgi:hypothetical protein